MKRRVYLTALLLFAPLTMANTSCGFKSINCTHSSECMAGERCIVRHGMGRCVWDELPGVGERCERRKDDAGRVTDTCPSYLRCGADMKCGAPLCWKNQDCRRNPQYGEGYVCSDGICARQTRCKTCPPPPLCPNLP